MDLNFEKSIEIAIYEDGHTVQPSILSEDLNEFLQRAAEAKYTRVRTYHRETGNLFEEAFFKDKLRHRDPNQGPASVRFNPIKGHPVMEQFVWEGKLHREDDFCSFQYDWESGAISRTSSKIEGEFRPFGIGSWIAYDVQTGIAVDEKFIYGPGEGHYSVGGIAQITRDRLTGAIISTLQFDGKNLVPRPELISTLNLE